MRNVVSCFNHALNCGSWGTRWNWGKPLQWLGTTSHRQSCIGTPWKIHILNPKNVGLVQMIFLFNWVILRFHVNFPECIWNVFGVSKWMMTCGVLKTTRWWFQIIFIFTPTWGDDPVWRVYFSDGLKPPTRKRAWSVKPWTGRCRGKYLYILGSKNPRCAMFMW